MADSLGFANLPNQVNRKATKKGFELTVMVIGQSGLGKSTLINCLFKTDLYKDIKPSPVAELIYADVKMTKKTVDIEEGHVKLKLTVVSASNFGDALDCSSHCEPILAYIDRQFSKYFEQESGINRRNIEDGRVHCCFYFISPHQWSLTPLDIDCMKKLHQKVNIIPLIAKADMLSKTEVLELKKNILRDLKTNGISVYSIPEDEDPEFREQMNQLRSAIPFAVSGSNQYIDVRGRKVLARSYPWGIHEVENPEHSDWCKLKSLIVTHMQDIQDVTHEIHYENYRTTRLAGNYVPAVHETDIDGSISSIDDITYEKDKQLQEKEEELKKMAQKIQEYERLMKLQQQYNNGTAGIGDNLNGRKEENS